MRTPLCNLNNYLQDIKGEPIQKYRGGSNLVTYMLKKNRNSYGHICFISFIVKN